MMEAIGKYVGGRVLTAVLVLATGGAGIWFWRHPEHLQTLWNTIKYVLVWLGFVLVLPWAGFLATQWVVAKDSNPAAALLLAGYVLADVLVAIYLIEGVSGHDALTWMVLLLGFLSAGVYNFLVCDFLADRLESI